MGLPPLQPRRATHRDTPSATAIETRTPTAYLEPTGTPTSVPPPASSTPSPSHTSTVRPTATPTLADVIAEAQRTVVRITMADGSGSGFIYDKTGWVLTNPHVIVETSEVTVIIGGRSRFTSRVVGVN